MSENDKKGSSLAPAEFLNEKQIFEEILARILEGCQEKWGDQFRGALLFGSTVHRLKPVSDIDLIVAVEGLTARRRDRIRDFEEIEARVEPLLRQLENLHGIHLDISEKLRTPEELMHFSPLYLDFPETSRVLLEKEKIFSGLIEKTHQYIQKSGAHKVRRGLKWYWVLKDGVTADEEFEVGW
jgi:hypothetical protein